MLIFQNHGRLFITILFYKTTFCTPQNRPALVRNQYHSGIRIRTEEISCLFRLMALTYYLFSFWLNGYWNPGWTET